MVDVAKNPIYRTREWLLVRDQVLLRDGFRCQIRLPGCLGRANAADHRVELEDGGPPFDLGNLQAACRPCNTAKRNQAYAKRVARLVEGSRPLRKW